MTHDGMKSPARCHSLHPRMVSVKSVPVFFCFFFDLICKYSSQYMTIIRSFAMFTYISSKFKNTDGHTVHEGPMCSYSSVFEHKNLLPRSILS